MPLRVEAPRRWCRRRTVATPRLLLFGAPPRSAATSWRLSSLPPARLFLRRPPPPCCLSTARALPLLAVKLYAGTATRRTSSGGRPPFRPLPPPLPLPGRSPAPRSRRWCRPTRWAPRGRHRSPLWLAPALPWLFPHHPVGRRSGRCPSWPPAVSASRTSSSNNRPRRCGP